MESGKPMHTIVLDAGPILQNNPSISTLLAKSERLVSVPAVISEIRDASARARVETSLLPFLEIKTPSALSNKFVTEFARKTGDLAVLSKTDLQILALAYELECERNHGDWRLRKTPGQRKLNGSRPKLKTATADIDARGSAIAEVNSPVQQAANMEGHDESQRPVVDRQVNLDDASQDTQAPAEQPAASQIHDVDDPLGLDQRMNHDEATDTTHAQVEQSAASKQPGLDQQSNHAADHAEASQGAEVSADPVVEISDDLARLQMPKSPELHLEPASEASAGFSEVPSAGPESETSDSDGWITPFNIKKHQAASLSSATDPLDPLSQIQVATITTDFAMQNVLLQCNLDLLSPDLSRIRNLRTTILRCHACFSTVKDTSRQFCPRCGKPTLTRVSCSTDAKGQFKLHLKKNMQWNTRGDRYSIPKPVPGQANGKVGTRRGGGKGGWGQQLILTEDQKEYQRQVGSKKGAKDLMDEDYLPGILTGNRPRTGDRPKVGAGRNVNSKKRN